MKANKEQLLIYNYKPYTKEEIETEVLIEMKEQDYIDPDSYEFSYFQEDEIQNFMNVMSDRLGLPIDFLMNKTLEWEYVLECLWHLKCKTWVYIIVKLYDDRAFEMKWYKEVANKLLDAQNEYIQLIDKVNSLCENYGNGLAD